MSQIISLGLESKIKNNRYSQFFSPNYKLHAKIPTFMLNAVEFIGSYMGIDSNSIYSHAIDETCDYFSLLDSNDSLIEFRNEFKIEWVELS